MGRSIAAWGAMGNRFCMPLSLDPLQYTLAFTNINQTLNTKKQMTHTAHEPIESGFQPL